MPVYAIATMLFTVTKQRNVDRPVALAHAALEGYDSMAQEAVPRALMMNRSTALNLVSWSER